MFIVRLFFLFCLAIIFQTLQAKETPKYVVDEIPTELKENARSVVRYSNQRLEIISSRKAIYSETRVVTVLNKNGLRDSYFVEYYDNDIKLKNISGVFYDGNGQKIKTLRYSEVDDFSAISGFSIYDDSRIKVYDPEIQSYPFTVEYSVERHFDGFFYLPAWGPYSGFNVAVENAAFELIYPDTMKIRYYQNNVTEASSEAIDGKKHVKWVVKDLPVIEGEIFMEPHYNFEPFVSVAPDDFEYDGYEGNLQSWSNLGDWIYELGKGRNNISIELSSELKELVNNLDSDQFKVKAVYKYLQDNTRYVSVQLGIGGYQPFEAETVERLQYGDCKALSNYMQTLLEAIGINSYYTLVNAGEDEDPIISDFPSNQFNHAFLCMPIENDTMWLECTSQTKPCGYLGSFTDDRDVLVISEQGGTLVRTPAYTAKQNRKVTKATVDFYDNGNATVDLLGTYTGPYMDEVFAYMRKDKHDQEKALYNELDLPKTKLNSFEFEVFDDEEMYATEKINFEVGNLGVTMGSNIFLAPNFLNQMGDLPDNPEDRLSDIFIRRSFSNCDTIVFNIPQHVSISALPKDEEIISAFGKYNCSFIKEENQLIYIRYFELNKGEYPKDKIHDLYDFAKAIDKADRKRVALKVNQ
jgi:hypothetical protein